jgi:predicted solute-binding protein
MGEIFKIKYLVDNFETDGRRTQELVECKFNSIRRIQEIFGLSELEIKNYYMNFNYTNDSSIIKSIEKIDLGDKSEPKIRVVFS